MRIWEGTRAALAGIATNKMRSGLTMLGVIIGVLAVVLLVSIGQGAKTYVSGEIQSLGSNLVFVLPGKVEFGKGRGGHPTGAANKLTLDLAYEIEKKVSSAEEVAPVVQASADVEVHGRERAVSVDGVTANFPRVMNVSVETGKFILSSHVNSARRVCAIGHSVARELFKKVDPIGETLTISGQRFTVIGLMEERGYSLGQDLDNMVYVPITTAQEVFGFDKVNSIVISAKEPEETREVVLQTEKVLGRRLSSSDFSVHSQEEMLGVFEEVLGALTLMLAGIAGISLLVGGIGIMNIMLVTVVERTREIGIRKAVGAKSRDILAQFVIEATTLSVVGGVVGILLGIGGSYLINEFLPSEVTWWSILLAFFFSAAVGIFFGVYPAYKASQLSPIDALRYE